MEIFAMPANRKRLTTLMVNIALLVTIVFSASHQLFSQQAWGSIKGTVRDSSGAVIPRAAVVVRQRETGVETKVETTGEGDYAFPMLRVGKYDVTASSPAFGTV